MQTKRISLLVMVLFLSMTFIPLLSMTPSRQVIPSTFIQDPMSKELAQVQTERIKVPVIADESVMNLTGSDTNFANNAYKGGVWVGRDAFDFMARAWLKYNLSHIPDGINVVSAQLVGLLYDEYNTQDLPIGVYYSENDTWSEKTITWNNQPAFNNDPTDVYDTGISPEMFVNGTTYRWDITNDVIATLSGNKVLTEVLKQVNETDPLVTWKYFVERDYNEFNATYIEIEYEVPEIGQVTVDGHSSAPLINYIQSDTPTFEWTLANTGTGVQKDYELEVWSNEFYNETKLMGVGGSEVSDVSSTGSTTNSRPFGTDLEMRFQFKYMHDLFQRSGLIDKLIFSVDEEDGTAIFENLDIYLLSVQNSSALTDDFQANYDGRVPVNVLHRETYSTSVENGAIIFDIENTFVLNRLDNLIIEFQFDGNTGDLLNSLLQYNANGSVAYRYDEGARTNNTAVYTFSRLHNMKLAFASDAVYDTGVTIENYFPFGVDEGTEGTIQFKYNASLFNEKGTIDRLFFFTSDTESDVIFEDFVLKLLETPVTGWITADDFTYAYGGLEPQVMIHEEQYVIHNQNGQIIIDLPNNFYYHGENDLLIEMSWSSRSGPRMPALRDTTGTAYRAFNLTYGLSNFVGNSTNGLLMQVEFIDSTTSIQYSGPAFVNGTTYYMRVRSANQLGIWSDWFSMSFTYAPLSSAPEFDNLNYPASINASESAYVSIDVTYFLGINQVLFEIDSANHTMLADAGTYSYEWSTSTAGNYTFTIYMESSIGTWSNTTGLIEVLEPSGGNGSLPSNMLLYILIGAIAVVIVIIIVKKRGK